MRVTFRKSFERDLRKIREQSLRQRVQEAIERIEAADTSQDIPNLERLSGASGFGRIRIGDYLSDRDSLHERRDRPRALSAPSRHLSVLPVSPSPPPLAQVRHQELHDHQDLPTSLGGPAAHNTQPLKIAPLGDP